MNIKILIQLLLFIILVSTAATYYYFYKNNKTNANFNKIIIIMKFLLTKIPLI